MTPTYLDHALFVLLAVFFPIRSRTFGYRRLRDAAPERVPQVRGALYRQAMVLQWSFTLAMLAWWAWQRRPWTDLGLAYRPHAWTLALTAGCVLLLAYLSYSLRGLLRDPESLHKLRRRIEHVERLMPRTDREMGDFLRLSLTAGLCEELLYRGFLFWYLAHWLPPLAVVGATAVVFGFGHSYQGTRGMVSTGLAGIVLGAIYLFGRTLFLPMALHAALDVYSGIAGRAALQAPEGEPYDSTGIADATPADAAAGDGEGAGPAPAGRTGGGEAVTLPPAGPTA